MTWTVFVEGGGKNKDLRSRCRDGFAKFLEPLNQTGGRPKIVACGTRADAYKRLRIALENDCAGLYLLLVDSETAIGAKVAVWNHVRNREGDRWQAPPNAKDGHLHFMAVCMESWLVSDPESLGRFYGKNFAANALPRAEDLEAVDKETIIRALQRATRDTAKGTYSKGKVSFAALGTVDVSVVQRRMSFCMRFTRQLTGLAEP